MSTLCADKPANHARHAESITERRRKRSRRHMPGMQASASWRLGKSVTRSYTAYGRDRSTVLGDKSLNRYMAEQENSRKSLCHSGPCTVALWSRSFLLLFGIVSLSLDRAKQPEDKSGSYEQLVSGRCWYEGWTDAPNHQLDELEGGLGVLCIYYDRGV